MSAKKSTAAGWMTCLLGFILTILSFAYSTARAENRDTLLGAISDPFDDPLRTRPIVLAKGVTLPGDADPLVCPSRRDFSVALTLSDAVNLSLCNNPQLREAWDDIRIQAAGVGQARAAYLPVISVNVNHLNTHTTYDNAVIPSTSILGDTVYGSLSWRLFDFGARDANRRAANSSLISAMASHDATLQKTMAATVQAYFDAQIAYAVVDSKKESEKIARDTLESANRREANGTIARGDVLQATTALAKATLDRSRALGSYHKAMAVLIYNIGIDGETPIALAQDEVDVGDGSAATAADQDLHAWLSLAANSHPQILAARAQWEAAQSKISSTRAEGLPTIDFTANHYQNGYPGQGISMVGSHVNTIGISLTVPIFDGFSHTYKVRAAQAQADKLRDQLADTEHSVAMEVVKVYEDAVSALENLHASQALLAAAQAALESSRRKYAKGAGDILDILNSQNALADARQERITCVSEWRSARLRLLANTGQLGKDLLGSDQQAAATLPSTAAMPAIPR